MKKKWLFFLAFSAIWLALRLPWLDCDAGIPSMWEYGYNVTDEGYYLVGGKEKLLWGLFVDLPRAETATYGYAPGMHFLSYLAHVVFGLSDWKWRIPFVLINFSAWCGIFWALARKMRAFGAFLVCVAISCAPLVVAYERTASNDVLIGSLLALACIAADGKGRWRLVLPAFIVTPIMLIKPSMWALLPFVVCSVMVERKTRSRLVDAAVFALSFALAFSLVKLSLYWVTLPESHANGIPVAEVIRRMNARYALPALFDFATHFKGLSCFPRDPSGTMLGPLALFLVPIPILFFIRRIDWRSSFGLFIPAYVGAVSVMNTIYTHYFLPVAMMVPLMWMHEWTAEKEGAAGDAGGNEKWPMVFVFALVAAFSAILWFSLLSFTAPDRSMADFYSRIYNLPARNVWIVSALPSVLFALGGGSVCALFKVARKNLRGLVSIVAAALLTGSIAFAMLPAVRIAPALHLPAENYVAPLVTTLALGAVFAVFSLVFPARLHSSWCVIPAVAVVAGYALIPSWRAAAVDLMRPGTHFHRDAARTIAKVLPDDAIVLGERADQMLISLPIRTSSTFLANCDGTVVADSILEKHPDAKLYLLADPENAYNLQNFIKNSDRYALRPVLDLKMPSFGDGRRLVSVHLCEIKPMKRKRP